MTTAPIAIDDSTRPRRLLRPSSGFLRFLLRRLAAFVLLAVGITFVVFALTQLVPSNAVATNLGEQAAGDPAAVAAFKKHYGLDKPLPLRYALYLEHVVQGDLGQSSLTHEAVTHDLGLFIPATAELAMSLGADRGLLRDHLRGHRGAAPEPADRPRPARRLARRHLDADVLDRAGRALRRLLPARLVPRRVERLDPGTTDPPHKTGLYTVDALLAGQWGLAVQALHHLVLPALVLAAFNVSLLTRYTRSAVLEVVGNDYVRAARAKGLPERIVVTRYILRAALPSVVTVLGLVFANVLTGAVLVEKIFSWPGIGQYAYQAAVNLDVPAIAGVSLFVAVVYITVNFIVDVLYGVIDPRIRIT